MTKEYFEVTSVSREDLKGRGFDVSKVDDLAMNELARKMGDAYLEGSYWSDLDIIAEYMGIPQAHDKHIGKIHDEDCEKCRGLNDNTEAYKDAPKMTE